MDHLTQESTYQLSQESYGSLLDPEGDEKEEQAAAATNKEEEDDDEVVLAEEEVEEEEKQRKAASRKKRRSSRHSSLGGSKRRKHNRLFYQALGAPARIFMADVFLGTNTTSTGTISSGTSTSNATTTTNTNNDAKEGGAPWASIDRPAGGGTLTGNVSSRGSGVVHQLQQQQMMHTSLQRRNRAQARWYYPMDFPIRQAKRTSELQAQKLEEYKAELLELQKEEDRKQQPGYRFKHTDILDMPRPPKKRPGPKPKPNPKKDAAPKVKLPLSDKRTTMERLDLRHQTQRKNNIDPFRTQGDTEGFLQGRVVGIIDAARASMLQQTDPIRTNHDNDNDGSRDDNDFQHLEHRRPAHCNLTIGEENLLSRQELQQQYADKVLQSHRMYDGSYLPVNWKLWKGVTFKLDEPAPYLHIGRTVPSLQFARQRLDYSDPAYLAPIPIGLCDGNIDNDDDDEDAKHYDDTAPPPPKNDAYGNCLVCIPCWCPVCTAAATASTSGGGGGTEDGDTDADSTLPRCPNLCLLHPIGPDLEILGVSTVQTPRSGRTGKIGALLKTRRNLDLQFNLTRRKVTYNECYIGDAIRQIIVVGGATTTTTETTTETTTTKAAIIIVLVRTSIHVTVVSIQACLDDSLPLHKAVYRRQYSTGDGTGGTFSKDNDLKINPQEGCCWGTFEVKELQRIDLRSFSSSRRRRPGGSLPSYVPIDVTAHPNFGGGAGGGISGNQSSRKFAILSHSTNRNGPQQQQEHNVIHHFLWYNPTFADEIHDAERRQKETKQRNAPSKGAKSGRPAARDTAAAAQAAAAQAAIAAGPPLVATLKSHITKHVITNLKAIKAIAFTTRHPMVLWAVAIGWVQPTLTNDRALRTHHYKPRMGGGYSLYTIDLRTNEATFQWSPSGEEFIVEGVHSISGISTESPPNKPSYLSSEQQQQQPHSNRLWVSSISAGKVWELDGQAFPLRVVNTWSLPGQCNDDHGPTLPSYHGLYGAGSLWARPLEVLQTDDNIEESDLPILLIDKTEGSFGLQMYQRPTVLPRFETKSMEAVSSPAVSSWLGKKHGVTMGSIFPAPNLLEESNVFACGIAAVSLPVTSFLAAEDCLQLGLSSSNSRLLCVFNLMSTGDIFMHSLLGSKREIGGLATACNKIEEGNKQFPMEAKLGGGMNLYLNLATSSDKPKVHNTVTDGITKRGRKDCVNEASDKDFIRPFQYCDLRYIPSKSVHTSTEKAEASPAGISIGPNVTANDIVASPNNNTDDLYAASGLVTIPVFGSEKTKQQVFESVSTGFLPHSTPIQNKVRGAERSDATTEFLDFATELWLPSISQPFNV